MQKYIVEEFVCGYWCHQAAFQNKLNKMSENGYDLLTVLSIEKDPIGDVKYIVIFTKGE